MTESGHPQATEALATRLSRQDLTRSARDILASEGATDVIEDLHLRLLTGSMQDLDEATEFLVEGLEGVPGAPEDEDELDEVAEELALTVWRDCYAVGQQWSGQETDVIRLFRTFNVLIRDKNVSCGMFTDWPSLELSDEDRGGVLVWVNAWEDLSAWEERNLMIGYVGTSASDEEVGRDLFDALAEQGMRPQEPVDGSVTVPVLWRWPVDDPDEEIDDEGIGDED